MDLISLWLLAIVSLSALGIFYLRQELGIAVVLLLSCYFVPLQNLILPHGHYLLDRFLDFSLYYLLIGVVLVKNSVGKKFTIIKTPLNLPMILFLGSIAITFILSLVLFSVQPGLAFMGLMDMSHYIMFFVVIYSIKNEKQLNFLIIIMFAIAVVSAILSVISSLVPNSPLVFAHIAGARGIGFSRTFPHGTPVVIFVFLLSIGILPFLKSGLKRTLLLGELIILLFAIVLTFTRSIWLPITITIAGLVLLLPRKKIGNYCSWLVTIAALAMIVSISLNYFLPIFFGGGIISTAKEDFLSSFKVFEFSGGLTGEPSLNARILEAQTGWDVARKNLITGVGYKYRLDVLWGTVSYLHNGYVSILMVQGLIGFIPFMWLMVVFFFRSLKIYRSLNESPYKGVVLGFIGGFWFILMYAFLGNGLQHGKTLILVLMLIMGLCEVVYKLNKEKEIGVPG